MGYSELKDRRYEIGSAGVVSLSGINYEREEFFFFFFAFPLSGQNHSEVNLAYHRKNKHNFYLDSGV